MKDKSICYCDEDSNEEDMKHMLLSRNKEWMKKKDGSNTVNDSLKTVVLACVDSRVQVERIFQAKPGEILVLKNAGNMITEDILRSIIVAIFELKAKFFIILGHTRCGMSIIGNEEKIDHLSGELGDTLEKLKGKMGQDPLKWFKFFPKGKWVDNIHLQVNYIRELLSELIDECHMPCIIPALYDLDSGEVTFLD
ncbi:MAG: carbonic anhydrase [Promethearchaeota archaeon]